MQTGLIGKTLEMGIEHSVTDQETRELSKTEVEDVARDLQENPSEKKDC
jgi:hypothetical protein